MTDTKKVNITAEKVITINQRNEIFEKTLENEKNKKCEICGNKILYYKKEQNICVKCGKKVCFDCMEVVKPDQKNPLLPIKSVWCVQCY